MKTYCVNCKKYTANENSSVRKTKQNRLMLLSNCAICGKKKSTFIKNKEFHNFNNRADFRKKRQRPIYCEMVRLDLLFQKNLSKTTVLQKN